MGKYNHNFQQRQPDPGLHITTVRDLEKYRQGQIVSLPPFAEGQPFVARLQRPSMLMLAKSKKIPNALLTTANRIFYRGGAPDMDDLDSQDTLPMMCDMLECIVEASLIEPTYADIKKAGMTLTDQQMMFIFNYSQEGVKALEPFRDVGEGDQPVQSVEPLQASSVGYPGDRGQVHGILPG